MKEPLNFFIIGAPKCGTSALASYLSSHPNISFSNPKEPHYFSSDLPEKSKVDDYEQYKKTFVQKENTLAYGEGSVWYLYSTKASYNILKHDKNAKIIILLRNPKKFLESIHNQNTLGGHEKEEALQKALEKPTNPQTPIYKNYGKLIEFDKFIDVYIKNHGRNNILILLQESLLENPLENYKKALNFLKIPYDGRIDFPKVNKRRKHKNIFLKYLLTRKWSKITPIINKMKKIFNTNSFGLYKKLMDYNSIIVNVDSKNPILNKKYTHKCNQQIQKIEKEFKELEIRKYWT